MNAPGAKMLLENDAADFFAWLVGYWTLITSEARDDDLQAKFIEWYSVGCPYCHQIPCACPREKRLGNRAEFISFNLLNDSPDLARELDRRLTEIKDSLTSYPELSKELEPELEKAAKSRTNVIQTLLRVADKVKNAEETVGAGENIIRRVSAAVEWIERTFSHLQG
jgi:hypothetical protein